MGKTDRAGRRWRRGLASIALALALLMVAWPGAVLAGRDEVRHYTVRPGDTLSEIALWFDVSVGALMQANGLRNPNHIYTGQVLVIPGAWHDDMDMGQKCVDYHTVRRNQTLSAIAAYYGIDPYDLARANGIYNLNQIYSGQKLCIPGRGKGEMKPPMGGTGGPVQAMPMKPPPMGMPMETMPPMDPPMKKPMDRPMDSMPPMDARPDRPEMKRPPEKPMQGPPPKETPWHGVYYRGKYFEEVAFEREDPEIRFYWGTGSPGEGLPENYFSVKWERIAFFPPGTYRFFATADDGVRVFVDGQLIIDGWHIQPATEYQADIQLQGGYHKVQVDYFEESNEATIRVHWEARR